ncbi:MAG: MFS transporter [Pirellulales bacterium]|nr:MFS transporter [Pirellulales bacterium]
MNQSSDVPQRLTITHWLILFVAVLGFAFDIYELLMLPLIAPKALAELLGVDPMTEGGFQQVLDWTSTIQWSSAVCGGVFGLLGGYLTDRFGRRAVLTWSILVYAVSAAAAGFSTSAPMLLALRCTTFIGVCVEFVAAVAWLAEIFPNPKQREWVLGITQAFSSVGGLMAAGAYRLAVAYGDQLPAIYGAHDAWRYTLISGLIPAIPLIVIRPFLPESPAWKAKRAAGTLKRPSIAELFAPALRRTTIATTILFACSYGAAFGAIQLAPQLVPGLVPELRALKPLREKVEVAKQSGQDTAKLRGEIRTLLNKQEAVRGQVQTYQELGGLLGRIALAVLAVVIVSRKGLLWLFQVPGLIVFPLAFAVAGTKSLDQFKWLLALCGFCTVAQFSFWGNYLPRVYPLHLRGTGEGFAANVGGRMIGTLGTLFTTQLAPHMPGETFFHKLAYACTVTAVLVYGVGFITSFWLPEPKAELD